MIGIGALTLAADVFAAPEFHLGVLSRLTAAHQKARELAQAALDGTSDPAQVGHLLTTVTGLHADMTAISAEWPHGHARAKSARHAVWALTGMLEAIRILEAATDGKGLRNDQDRQGITARLAGQRSSEAAPPSGHLDAEAVERSAPGQDLIRESVRYLLDRNEAVSAFLEALRDGRSTPGFLVLPLYRSKRQAARNAVRAASAILIAAALFVLSGWPGTSTGLAVLGTVIGLSASNPNPMGFASALLKALPAAVVAGGITEFVILNGADEFPLLAMAMVPTTFIACFCLASGKPTLFGFGLLLLVYFNATLQPANPQLYNPQSYLTSSILSLAAAVMLHVALTTLLPTTDARKRGWIFRSLRTELVAAAKGSCSAGSETALTYRAADRIGQLAALQDGDPAGREADLRRALWLTDLATTFRRARLLVAPLRSVPASADLVTACDRALSARDPALIRHVAERLRGIDGVASDLGATMAWAAKLTARSEREPSGVGVGHG